MIYAVKLIGYYYDIFLHQNAMFFSFFKKKVFYLLSVFYHEFIVRYFSLTRERLHMLLINKCFIKYIVKLNTIFFLN